MITIYILLGLILFGQLLIAGAIGETNTLLRERLLDTVVPTAPQAARPTPSGPCVVEHLPLASHNDINAHHGQH